MTDARAVVLTGPRGPVGVESISLPALGPRDVLVRMEACGLCHSDLLVAGMEKLPQAPLVLGHEGIGIVEELGPEVRELALGDRVGITFLASTCRDCEYCFSGRERFCARQVNHGYSRHGVLATRAVVPVQNLALIPAGLEPAAAAPLCCAGWTAYSAVRQSGLEKGRLLGIFGLGGLGHLGLQYARDRGLRVAAADVSQRKLELARALGAEVAVPASNAGRILLNEHGGLDGAVVFTADTAAISQAFRALKRDAVLVVSGLPTARWEMPIFDAVLKGVALRGSYLGTRADLAEVFRLAIRGIGRPQIETCALDDIPRMLERLGRGEIEGRAVAVF